MSYGTYVDAEIYLNRRIYDNIYQLESDIAEVKQEINDYWQKILAYMVATPHDYKDEDGYITAAPDFIADRCKELREGLEESLALYNDMLYLKENFDKRVNG